MLDIFSYFVAHGDESDKKRTAYSSWFLDHFPATEFKGIDLLYRCFTDFCSTLGVAQKHDYLNTFVNTEMRSLMKSMKIHVAGTETFTYDEPTSFETAVQITIALLNSEFEEMEKQDLNIDDFPVAISSFMSTKLTERLTGLLSDSFSMLSETDNSLNALDYLDAECDLVKMIYNQQIIEELSPDYNHDKVMRFVTDTGLKALDADTQGLRTRQLIEVEGRTGGGKTRFVSMICHRAAVLHHQNVAYYTLEQNASEIESLLISHHVFYLWGDQIAASMIDFKTVPEELKDKVETARIDLFESGKYGKIKVENVTLYYENFITRFKNDDKLFGPFDMFVVDYAYLIRQQENTLGKYKPHKERHEIMYEAYYRSKAFARNYDKLVIHLNQYNRDGEAAALADKDIDSSMVAGGMDVYRSVDHVFALTRTAIMESQNRMTLQQTKKRGTKGIYRLALKTRLGFCYFEQDVNNKLY